MGVTREKQKALNNWTCRHTESTSFGAGNTNEYLEKRNYRATIVINRMTYCVNHMIHCVNRMTYCVLYLLEMILVTLFKDLGQIFGDIVCLGVEVLR